MIMDGRQWKFIDFRETYFYYQKIYNRKIKFMEILKINFIKFTNFKT